MKLMFYGEPTSLSSPNLPTTQDTFLSYLESQYAQIIEGDEAEKFELVKRHMGLKKNKDVIKALILEKFDEIKLEEKNLTKQRIAEEKAMEYSESFTCPLFK